MQAEKPVAINPQKIAGNWRSGVALDLHTLSSTHLGTGESGRAQFDTKRTELGELLHRLKYRFDQTALPGIVTTAAGFLMPHREKFDSIIPVPPSTVRAPQPVIEMVKGIGAGVGIPVLDCIRTTRPATVLKNVDDPEKRRELLDGLYTVDPAHTAGRSVLLFDDLFRSGATMNAITDVLKQIGQVASVRVLTITRTRSKA